MLRTLRRASSHGVGSRLWTLLTRYYLDIEQVTEQLGAAAIYALLLLLMTQLMVSESSWLS